MLVKRTIALTFNDPVPEPGKLFGVETAERKEVLKIIKILKLDWGEVEGHKLLLVTVTARVVE